MKIIYVYDTIAVVGGIERIFVDKMNYLADHLHHEVYLITSSQGEHPISFPLSPNVQHIDLDIRYHVRLSAAPTHMDEVQAATTKQKASKRYNKKNRSRYYHLYYNLHGD